MSKEQTKPDVDEIIEEKISDNFINKVIVSGVEYDIQASSIGTVNKLDIKSDEDNDAKITFSNSTNNNKGEIRLNNNNLEIYTPKTSNIITNTENITLPNSTCDIEFIGNEIDKTGSFQPTNVKFISNSVNNSGEKVYIEKKSGNIAKETTVLYFEDDKTTYIYNPKLSYSDAVKIYNSDGSILQNGIYYVEYGGAIFKISVNNGFIVDNTINNYKGDRICKINEPIDLYDKKGAKFSISEKLSGGNDFLPLDVLDGKSSFTKSGFYLVNDANKASIVYIDNESKVNYFDLYSSNDQTILDCCYIQYSSSKIETVDNPDAIYYSGKNYVTYSISKSNILIDYGNVTIYDKNNSEDYNEFNDGDIISNEECSLGDIVTLVKYMKDNNQGPWDKQ